jgi:hypothetical protein
MDRVGNEEGGRDANGRGHGSGAGTAKDRLRKQEQW